MIDFSQLHWLRPAFLLWLIPALFLMMWFHRLKAKHSPWQEVCDPHLVKELISNSPSRHNWFLTILLTSLLFLAIIALAGPSWQRKQMPFYKNSYATVIALDLSPAMLGQDLSPDRMTRSQFKILDLLNNLDGQIGLVVFTSETYVVSPLTNDNKTLASFIPQLKPDMMPVSGASISDALKKAVQLIYQAQQKKGAILLVTANDPQIDDFEVARQLNKNGIKLDILGVGTSKGSLIVSNDVGNNQNSSWSHLNEKALNKLAQAGGGIYLTLTPDNTDIKKLENDLAPPLNNLPKKETSFYSQMWLEQGYYLVMLMLPLFLFLFRKGMLDEV